MTPTTPETRPLQFSKPNSLKIDSDQAFKVAQQHGGEKLTNADPNQPIFYTLDVDASNGHFLRAEK